MQKPVLTDKIRESLEKIPIRGKINKPKARVTGEKYEVISMDAIIEAKKLCKVTCIKGEIFAEKSVLHVKDATIDAKGCKIVGTRCKIFGEGNFIYGSDHVGIRGEGHEIYANDCKDIVANNCTLFGHGCVITGENNVDKGENTLKDPPPPPPPPIDPGEVDADLLIRMIGIPMYEERKPQAEVHICEVDETEEELSADTDLTDDEICQMCFARKRTTFFIPCKHVTLCTHCAQEYRNPDKLERKCPSCFKPFIAIVGNNEKKYVM